MVAVDAHRPPLTSQLGQRDGRRVFASLTAPAPNLLSIDARPPAHNTSQNEQQTLTMSSLLDAVLNSDAAPTPSSDVGNPRQQIRSSSARPRGPPSESAGANSDVEFADDEVIGARVPGRRTNAARTDIPKVVDVTGETLSLRFQEFLEK